MAIRTNARILVARTGTPNGSRVVAASHLDVEEVWHLTDLLNAMSLRPPAVLLLSIDFPGLNGAAGIPGVRKVSPATRIIVLTKSVNDLEELEVLRMGAKGYCGEMEAGALIKMIEKVQQGEIWAARRAIGALVDEFYGAGLEFVERDENDEAVDRKLESLTFREREILRLLAAGASNKEIAGALNVTVATVKGHLTKMFRKLDQPDRLHLALYATRTRRNLADLTVPGRADS
jgi:two-component system nitrate/nitrite response regulator NarL